MAPLNIAPTRSKLLQMRSKLAFAREGFSILDKKREVLTAELLRVAGEAESINQQAQVLF